MDGLSEQANGVAYRIQRLEQDVTELRNELRDYSAMRERVENLTAQVKVLGTEVVSLRRALIGAALSVTGAAVIFAITVLQVSP